MLAGLLVAVGFLALATQSVLLAQGGGSASLMHRLNPLGFSYLVGLPGQWPWWQGVLFVLPGVTALFWVARKLQRIPSVQTLSLLRGRRDTASRLRRYPGTITQKIPSLSFELKKLWVQKKTGTILVLCLLLLAGGAARQLRIAGELGQDMESYAQFRLESEEQMAQGTDPPYNQQSLNRAEQLREILPGIASHDPQAGVSLHLYALSNQRDMLSYNPMGYTGETLLLREDFLHELRDRNLHPPVSKSYYAPMSPFDQPRDFSERLQLREFTTGYLAEQNYTVSALATGGLLAAAAGLLLLVLANGFSTELDNRQTIHLLHMQPVSAPGLYLANLSARWLTALASAGLAAAVLLAVFTAYDTPARPDYPAVRYENAWDADSGMRFVWARSLTNNRGAEQTGERSADRIGYAFRPLAEENRETLLLLGLMIVVVIAFSGIVALAVSSAWAAAAVSLLVFFGGFLLSRTFLLQAAAWLPFIWADAARVASGEAGMAADSSQLLAATGFWILPAYTLLFTLAGLWIYRKKYHR